MKKNKDLFISPDEPVLGAIDKLNRNRLQIVIALSENERIHGVVTDGDIRRGILEGISVNMPVEKIINHKPIVASVSDSRDEILEKLKKNKIRQCPVVNEQGKFVRIDSLDDMIGPSPIDNWVILMAGGLGTRLQHLTAEIPKPLLNINGKPILEIIIENLISYGFYNFFISVNYKADMIKNYFEDGSQRGVNIRYVHEDNRLGTAGALSLLPIVPEDPVIVMNSDLITEVNFTSLLDFHNENISIATICTRQYDFQVPFGVVEVRNNNLVNISEKPVHKFFINAGIYVLNPEILKFIPRDTFFDMPTLFELLVQKKLRTKVFPILERWIDIGQEDDLKKAMRGDY